MTDEVKPKPGFLRRTWPWFVGIAILAFIITRIPFDAFRQAVTEGPHLTLLTVNLLLISAVLASDSVSTWIGLRALGMARPFTRVLAVRGATYVLFLVNYALGQGGFGYYLHKSGTTALRAVGATLFLIGTNLATLLLVTSVAWLARGYSAYSGLGWTLAICCVAFAVYLLVVYIRPGFLSNREALAPLFEAKLRGYAIAMLGRLPHTAVIVVGHWLAMRVWGIEVPFVDGLTLMPAVVIISVLPISPAGLGTAQAAMVYFFADFAAGSTPDERNAAVLAFGIVYFVYGIIASMVVGLACTPFAKKLALDDVERR